MEPVITFKDYADLNGNSKSKMRDVKCMLTDVAIIDELDKYADDFYYIEFITRTDINQLVCYPVYIKKYEKEFKLKFRRELIDAGHEEQNILMNIPLEFHKLNFQNLQVFPDPKADYLPGKLRAANSTRETIPGQRALIDKAKHYCAKDIITMLITGAHHGQGKSLVAACIAKEKFITQGLTTSEIFDEAFTLFNSSIIFINEFQLISLLDLLPEQMYLRYSLQQIIRRLSDCDVLVIDDMFRVKSKKTFLNLLDVYEPIIYNRLEIKKKDTVITTNKDPEVFKKLSGYIYSRLKPGIIHNCEFNKDYRGVIAGMKEDPK